MHDRVEFQGTRVVSCKTSLRHADLRAPVAILRSDMTDESAGGLSPNQSADIVMTLPDSTKVKQRLPRMRACNERNAKGKLCAGHLKRWYKLSEAAKQQFGSEAELYRCE